MQERILGDLPDDERDAARRVGFPLRPELLLVLTDRRLMVWSVTKMLNRPDDVLGEVPLADLAGVERGEGKLVTANVPKMTLRFRGGEELGLVTARPNAALLDGLVEALRQRLAPA